MESIKPRPWMKRMARIGLIAKGIVYLVLGALAFMAAFDIGATGGSQPNRSGTFSFVQKAPAGNALLAILAAGLLCYCVWRFIQAFRKERGQKQKKLQRVRYVFSGLAYTSLAFTALRVLFGKRSGGDSNQKMSAEVLDHPFGQWALGIAALAFAAIGIYQMWYAWTEKYRKHVQELNTRSKANDLLLLSGKVGYTARGLVWLLVSFLLLRAAVHANATEAGDTGKAFRFVESNWGPWLLAGLGIGLIAYGLFNFIRARYESFQ